MPVMLATGEARPSSIAVFGGAVYWTTDPASGPGQVRKLAPGGTVQTLASNEASPLGLAVGNGLVEPTAFWGTDTLLGQIRQVAATGAPPIGGADVNDVVYALVLDGDAVFAGTRGAVVKKGLGNVASPSTLAGGYNNGVTAVAADAAGVVFGARTFPQGTWIVAAVARTGGTVTTLATEADVIRDIAIAGGDVFFLERGQLKKVARAGGTPAVVKSFTNGETPWALVSSQGKLFVATNQGVINPSGATGRILEIDAATGAEREIAKEQPEPADVAVDAGNIYWANRGLAPNQGQIVRIAR